MDKEIMVSYLANVRKDMREGKFIKAYDSLYFVLTQLNADVKKDKEEGK